MSVLKCKVLLLYWVFEVLQYLLNGFFFILFWEIENSSNGVNDVRLFFSQLNHRNQLFRMFICLIVIIFLEILDSNLWQFIDVLFCDFNFMFMIFVFANEEFDLIGGLFAPSINQLLPNLEKEGFKTVVDYNCVLLGVNAVLKFF